MAQLDGMQRYVDNLRSPATPTIEQFRAGEASSWSPNTSPTLRNHDPEEDHGAHHHKKSVLTKVKEKAKKLRHTLSHKKRHGDDDNYTPSWGVRLEDDKDEDPEYLGASMYESEMAPERLKETARQHPRSIIPEKHVLTSPDKHGVEQEKEKRSSPDKKITETMTEKLSPAHTTVSDAITSRIHGFSGSPKAAATETDKHADSEKPYSPNKTITETVTEKRAPAYATMSDATHAITSKIQGFTAGSAQPAANETDKNSVAKTYKPVYLEKPHSPSKTITETVTMSDATHSIQGLAVSTHADPETDKDAVAGTNDYKHAVAENKKFSAPELNRDAALETKHTSTGEKIWDKGVSVKEYIMQKFEPGEDDRALSQVISQAISPMKTPGDPGVVERVKGAVTSLLWDEESKNPRVTHSTTNSISNIPISTNAYEVVEEENHGRILQAN